MKIVTTSSLLLYSLVRNTDVPKSKLRAVEVSLPHFEFIGNLSQILNLLRKNFGLITLGINYLCFRNMEDYLY